MENQSKLWGQNQLSNILLWKSAVNATHKIIQKGQFSADFSNHFLLGLPFATLRHFYRHFVLTAGLLTSNALVGN
ncbi:MAG: hypothetical protein VX541_02600 [Candidatus Poribacteria bacterium]|nr:hypothetical protein [Candidatus Poribacteria bacterium]